MKICPFVDLQAISTLNPSPFLQEEGNMFGPVDALNFRVSSLHKIDRSINQTFQSPLAARAVTNGFVIYQKNTSNNEISLILKPYIGFSMTVKYFVYKNIKADYIFANAGTNPIVPSTPLVQDSDHLLDIHSILERGGVQYSGNLAATASLLGLFASGISDSSTLDDLFAAFDPIPVQAGDTLGFFDYDNGFAFEVLLNDPVYEHKVGRVRNSNGSTLLTVNAFNYNNASLADSLVERENCLAYADPACFYISEVTKAPDRWRLKNTASTSDDINVFCNFFIGSFFRKTNRVYFDIRDKFSNSVAFFREYDYGDISFNIKSNTTVIYPVPDPAPVYTFPLVLQTDAPIPKRQPKWPLVIIEVGDQYLMDSKKAIKLKLNLDSALFEASTTGEPYKYVSSHSSTPYEVHKGLDVKVEINFMKRGAVSFVGALVKVVTFSPPAFKAASLATAFNGSGMQSESKVVFPIKNKYIDFQQNDQARFDETGLFVCEAQQQTNNVKTYSAYKVVCLYSSLEVCFALVPLAKSSEETFIEASKRRGDFKYVMQGSLHGKDILSIVEQLNPEIIFYLQSIGSPTTQLLLRQEVRQSSGSNDFRNLKIFFSTKTDWQNSASFLNQPSFWKAWLRFSETNNNGAKRLEPYISLVRANSVPGWSPLGAQSNLNYFGDGYTFVTTSKRTELVNAHPNMTTNNKNMTPDFYYQPNDSQQVRISSIFANLLSSSSSFRELLANVTQLSMVDFVLYPIDLEQKKKKKREEQGKGIDIGGLEGAQGTTYSQYTPVRDVEELVKDLSMDDMASSFSGLKQQSPSDFNRPFSITHTNNIVDNVFIIHLNTWFNQEELGWVQTIVHELCHCYIINNKESKSYVNFEDKFKNYYPLIVADGSFDLYQDANPPEFRLKYASISHNYMAKYLRMLIRRIIKEYSSGGQYTPKALAKPWANRRKDWTMENKVRLGRFNVFDHEMVAATNSLIASSLPTNEGFNVNALSWMGLIGTLEWRFLSLAAAEQLRGADATDQVKIKDSIVKSLKNMMLINVMQRCCVGNNYFQGVRNDIPGSYTYGGTGSIPSEGLQRQDFFPPEELIP